MKEKQGKKLKMHAEVLDVLKKNSSHWSEINVIKTTYDELLMNNNEIRDLQKDSERDISPLELKKVRSRETLIDKTLPVANILRVFATDTGDKKLAKATETSRKQLEKTSDTKLVKLSQNLWKKANKQHNKSLNSLNNLKSESKKIKFEPNIHEYGLTNQSIDELESANKTFVDALFKLKDAYTQRAKTAKQIKKLMSRNNGLLKRKLDRLMTIFETKKSSFYKDYLDARSQKNAKATNSEKTKDHEVLQKKKPVNSKPAPKTVKKPVINKPATKKAAKKKAASTTAKKEETKPSESESPKLT